MTANGDIGGEHTDLAVRYLASRTCILTCNTARCLALLEEARLINDQNRIPMMFCNQTARFGSRELLCPE